MRGKILQQNNFKFPRLDRLRLSLLAFLLLLSLLISCLWSVPRTLASEQNQSCGDDCAPTFDPPDFTISADPTSQTVEQGEIGTYGLSINTVNCYTATVTLSVAGLPDYVTFAFAPAVLTPPSDSTLTITTTADTPPGTYALIISGDSGELHHETGVDLIVNEAQTTEPDFSIAASPASQAVDPGGGTGYVVSLDALDGFSDTVSLSIAGLPTGAGAVFDPDALTPPGDSSLLVTTTVDTPPGTYALLISGDSGELHHETGVDLIVNEAQTTEPDFSIAASPASQAVDPGGGAGYVVSLDALDSFSDTVSLSIAGLPTGTGATFDPDALTPPGDSSLLVTTTVDTPPGTYALIISGDSGELHHETGVDLIVNELSQQAVVSVSPAEGAMFVGETAESQILLSNATSFYGAEFYMTYNPAVLQIVDADPTIGGVQIALGDLFPEDQHVVGANQVYTDTGLIVFGVARRAPAPPVYGGGVLALVTWEAVAEGVSDLSFTHLKLADPSGFELDAVSQDGSMAATQTGQLSGVVHLQGRVDHSGVEVNVSPGGLQTVTDLQGLFRFLVHGTLTITARMYGYLDAQAAIEMSPGESVDLGATTLYGGEVTGDNLIDIGDLAYLGARFHSDDLTADINGDGQVDILDLAMAAANFLMSGPTPWAE